ncbi:MAG: stage III sporulation protein AB [Oscillospiraceae bacterium]|nr:stage III sporulation protein AB [Oscillospiraceae bacterium]
MIKILGIICILAACAGTGVYLAMRLTEQIRIYQKLLAFLQDCAVYIRYQGLPLQELFGLLAGQSDYENLDFLENLKNLESCAGLSGIPIESRWESALEHSRIPTEARQILRNLGHELGKTDTQGQLAVLELYQTQMQTAYEQFREDYQKKSRLYQSLGWLGGAMLAILFI